MLILHSIGYDWLGNENADQEPCSNTTADAVSCCYPTDSCATNGLCAHVADIDAITPYYLDGCTQADWVTSNVSGCPNNCVSSMSP